MALPRLSPEQRQANLDKAAASRRERAEVKNRLKHSGAPAVITQKGRETAVLIDIESFRQNEAEREVLAALVRGEQEIAEGLGYDLDEVLAEADGLLTRAAP